MNNHNQTNHPYSKFSNDELILRDELAVDRTLLANERTLLAYLRSAVSLVLAGVSIMHFSEQQWFWIIGLTCIPGGIAVAVIGIIRYRHMNGMIGCLRRENAGALPGLLDDED